MSANEDITFSRRKDMTVSGTDSTATYHDVGGEDWLYVFLGVQQDLLRYNLKTEDSEVVESLPFDPFGRKVHKPQPNENKVFVTPGNNDTSEFDAGDFIKGDPTNGNWEKIGNIGFKMDNGQAVAKNGDVYFWGGENQSTGDQTDGIRKIDGDTDDVDLNYGTLPFALGNAPSGITDEGRVYHFGGDINGSEESNEVWEVFPTKADAEFVGEMTFADNGSDATVWRSFGGFLEGDFYAFGGSWGGRNVDTSEVWKVDMDTLEVSAFDQMDSDRIDTIPGYYPLENQLYGFGGSLGPDNDASDVYRLNGPSVTRVIMVKHDLAILGRGAGEDDDVVLWDENDARAEGRVVEGDEVVMASEGLAQG